MSQRSGGCERSEQSGASEQMNGASERANGQASGPVLTYVLFSIFDNSATGVHQMRLLHRHSLIMMSFDDFLDATTHLYKRLCPSVRP